MTLWFLIIGALLILMALIGSVLKRLPLSTGVIYLLIGFALGSERLALIQLDPLASSRLLKLIAEVAVLVSLFSVGLKLRVHPYDRTWHLPVRLAVIAMLATIALLALVGAIALDLPLGAAILLGAILAPTDPVLASDVQVQSPGERDRVRFSLTGEGGLNDGIAFPFVLLGLGLLGLHDLGPYGVRWLAVDVVWATAAGLGSGWLCGFLVGRLVIHLRREYSGALGLEEFLALGLIAFAYGFALLIQSYGFLAVFAAGFALRRIEHVASGVKPIEIIVEVANPEAEREVATHPDKAPVYMTQALLSFNSQLERIVEVGVVLLLGSLLSVRYWAFDALWFAPLLFLVIRPVSVALGLTGSPTPKSHRRLIAWFGIRGIGSLYYLMYAIQQGLATELAEYLASLVLTVVAASIIVHGISATPLMEHYYRRKANS